MKVRVVILASYNVFIEMAQAIGYSMTELGAKSFEIQDLNRNCGKQMKTYENGNYDLTFIFAALKAFHPGHIKGKSILFQTEELWNRREKGIYYGLHSEVYDRVLEMYDENCKLGNTRNVVYCPVGYSPVWESNLPKVEEDIDILFHGSITERRRKFETAFGKQGMGLDVIFTKDAYGKKRDELIARSKIVINIKAHKKWSYGPMHCLPAQANKKFMLAEKADGGYGPFVPGLHVAEYDGIKDCQEKVKYWLSHEKERKEFAEKAYADMIVTCNFTDILKKALKKEF